MTTIKVEILETSIYQCLETGEFFSLFEDQGLKGEIDEDFFGDFDKEQISSQLPSRMFLFTAFTTADAAKSKDFSQETSSGWILEIELESERFHKIQ